MDLGGDLPISPAGRLYDDVVVDALVGEVTRCEKVDLARSSELDATNEWHRAVLSPIGLSGRGDAPPEQHDFYGQAGVYVLFQPIEGRLRLAQGQRGVTCIASRGPLAQSIETVHIGYQIFASVAHQEHIAPPRLP